MDFLRTTFGFLILFSCATFLSDIVLLPGASAVNFVEFGKTCDDSHPCKNYNETVTCIKPKNESMKRCDCIWNEKDAGKYTLNSDNTRCVGLVRSPCNLLRSFDEKIINCTENAVCVGGRCKCHKDFSQTSDLKCLLDFGKPCSVDAVKNPCHSFEETVSCSNRNSSSHKSICDCSLNTLKEPNGYTIFNKNKCVGNVNSYCNSTLGCIHFAHCNDSNKCECDSGYSSQRSINKCEKEHLYGEKCTGGINNVPCKSHGGFLACIAQHNHENAFTEFKCDCKGNEEWKDGAKSYVWDNGTETCVGVVGSLCGESTSNGLQCVENAECKDHVVGNKYCECVDGWQENDDKFCIVSKNGNSTNILQETTMETPKANGSSTWKILLAVFLFLTITLSIIFIFQRFRRKHNYFSQTVRYRAQR